jgi:hypothetical protein
MNPILISNYIKNNKSKGISKDLLKNQEAKLNNPQAIQ